MRKRIIEGIAGLGLLAVLPACNTQKQAIPSADLYALAAGPVETVSEQGAQSLAKQLGRSILVPQLQVDAQDVYNKMITYICPDEELLPTVSVAKLATYIDFPAGSVQVNPKYGNNRAELAKLDGQLKPLLRTGNGKIKKIRITGYASPDGNTKTNEQIGRASCRERV